MSAAALVLRLRALGVELWAEGERLQYEAPADVLTPELLAELGERKSEVLAFVRDANAARERSLPPIAPVPRTADLPLSFAQQRLWFLNQLFGPGPAYHIPMAFEMRGVLDRSALISSLQSIVERHEALRTAFPECGGQPVQSIQPRLELALPVKDFSALTDSERDVRLQRYMVTEFERPFDLARGPLLRASLARLEDTRHVLLLTLHHVIADAWSLGVLFRELGQSYDAVCKGESSALPPLPLQYADFAVWQRDWLRGEALDRQLGYWRKALSGVTRLELPTDRPRPAVQSFDGARVTMSLPATLAEKLEGLSQGAGATLFMTLLAAFAVLLKRYSRQDDITVGSPIAGRNRAELEGLIGFFVNMLVMRVDLSGGCSFRTLLGRVRETALAAYEHQELPFEKLVDELGLERELSHNPLFQVAFTLQNAAVERLAFSEMELAMLPPPIQATRFDLEAHVSQGEGGLLVGFVYNTDLFEAGTVERMLGHYRRVLEAVAAAPDAGLDGLSLVDADERGWLLEQGADTAVAYPRDATLGELFAAQVRERPEAVAVEFEGETLSYRALNARANRLAHGLRALGVGRETRVGVCLARSLEMVVAVLGVVKSGGAYVPLDPEYPAARLTFMLEDSAASVLLTHSGLVEGLPETEAAVVCVDVEGFETASELDPEEQGDASALAYLMYTSGSTGEPKGTCIEQRSVVRLVKSANYLEMGPDEVWLQFAPISFDASTLELWGSLLNGGRLVVFPAHVPSLSELGAFITAHRISVLWLTAALFHRMVDEQVEALAGVGQLLAGGEALSPAHVKRMLARLAPGGRLVNGYGPTENTTFSCCHVMAAGSELGHSVPIGRPISNTTAYVLDGHGGLSPIGVAGDLYLGGDGLARGYWRRSALSAEKFVVDRFSVPGVDGGPPRSLGRLYHTGDRVRWRADGTLEFFGRVDAQVKLRGYRIELGEVEAVLGAHPAVREAVVVCREDTPGDKRLVGYVVAEDAGAAEPGDESRGALLSRLRMHLREQLPSYMVPAALVILEALPLNPNDKVDRAALPAPDPGRDLAGEATGPRTPVEEVIAAVWSEVLGVEGLGVHDNFFELGGHSLLAIQLLARLREAFRVELPLTCLFHAPTVAELATEVATRQDRAEPAPELPDLITAPRDRYEPFPLTQVQEAYWIGRSGMFELGNVATHSYVEAETRDFDLDRFNSAWCKVIARHDMLRAIIAPDGLQRVLPEVPDYAIRLLDVRERSPSERQAALDAVRDEMSHQVLPTDQWPLIDIRATRLEDQFWRLHFGFDAIILDAWSLNLVFREWLQLYLDPSIELEPLTLTFRDLRLTEESLKATESYRRAREYWLKRIDTLPAAPALPLAKQPDAISKPRFVSRNARLDQDTWSRLKKRAVKAGLSSSGVVLAAFSEVLKYWSQQPRFTLNLTLFNRLPLHPRVNDVVGDFTSLTLLEIANDPGASFEERARRIQEQLWNDLDRNLVSGVEVLRELAKQHAGRPRAAMPVVFTSVLEPGHTNKKSTGAKWPWKSVYSVTQTPQVWLDHGVLESEGVLSLIWNSIDELFPEGLVDTMFDAYQGLLEALANEPESWQDSWTETTGRLLPQSQRNMREALNAGGDRAGALGPAQLLHELFAIQAQEQAEHPAVIAPDRELSYAELFRLGNQLGRLLRASGAAPNQLVGVLMDKGWEQVVSVLGVLASGAAYLPIDAALPADRVRYLLEHGQVKLVVTRSGVENKLGLEWPQNIERVYLDPGSLEAVDAAPLDPVQQPDDLAYVIYTSGSTGLPKGVAIDHQGAVNTVLDINHRFSVTSADRVLGISSLSFDLSVYDVFGTLAAGGTLVIPDPNKLRDPAHWAELVAGHRVTVWNSVPALVGLLVDYAAGRSPTSLSSLRLVMMSGDWIPVDLPDRIRALLGGGEIISLGGATEASIWSICYPIERVDPTWSSIPYGRAMSAQQFYVLNEALEPCPDWVSGELYIGGIGLAKGYWRDPEKTQASFITHPRSGARLYRTGDYGRMTPTGNIEFLGREDLQVKIQGYRVELGEIEAALVQLPRVAAAVVAARGEARGEKRLVAYVVPEGELQLDALRLDLAASLPGYMVPAVYEVLTELPLSANGKIDRQALPEPRSLAVPSPETGADSKAASLPDGSVAAANPLESEDLARIAEIVAGVIKHPGLDVDTDLLNLGVTSVDIVRIVNRLDIEMDFRPNIETFYRGPTVRSLFDDYQNTPAVPGPPAAQPSINTGSKMLDSFEVIVDPEDREVFKNRNLSLRAPLANRTVIPLGRQELDAQSRKRLAQRRSYRDFDPAPVPLSRLSDLLGSLGQHSLDGKPKHLYASAGGLYPVQTYLYVKPDRVGGLLGGSYYFDPAHHRLLELSSDLRLDRFVYDPFINGPVFERAAFTIFLIADLDAIGPMYGPRSLHYATLEAGAMTQLLETTSPELGIGLCQVGDLNFSRIREGFALTDRHVLVLSMLGGLIDAQTLGEWSPYQEGYYAPDQAGTDEEREEEDI